MSRIFTIWPADAIGQPARTASAWQQQRNWLVLDISNGMGDACVVEGPVSRQEACHRELELRAEERKKKVA
jgi:hypothetical protein